MDQILWQPTSPHKSNLWQFMQWLGRQQGCRFADYQALYDFSIQNPRLFWPAVCAYFKLEFDTPAREVLTAHEHMIDAQWFPGASFNFAEQLLRRNDDHPALVSLDELGRREVISYQALRIRVAECAAGLARAGVQAHDRVAGVLPNVAFTIIAMLATTALGAIWSCCSPDFGAKAIVDRLGQIEPKVLFICDGHSYQGKIYPATSKIQDLMTGIPSLETIVIYPHLPGPSEPIAKTQTLAEFLVKTHVLNFAPFPFAEPIYILFSSGTTGQPKCIVHGAGGTLVQHLKELGLHTDIKPEDNLLFYTTCGWMMWNWMVSVLALGATLTLYEGSPTYPNALRLFEILDEEKITVFGTSAKFIATLEKQSVSPVATYRLVDLRLILATGSPLLPHHFDYVAQHIKAHIPLASMSGGTDIISCFALANPLLPVYSGALQCIGLGMAVNIYDDHARPVHNQPGELVCTQAFPAMPVGFWNDPGKKRYKSTYFEQIPGVWVHGDLAALTPHHGLIIYGRSDATLKPGGVRIGTAEIYRQIDTLPEIVESVVIGQHFQDDVRVVLFVQLATGMVLDETLQKKIRQKIHDGASPRHVPAVILQVPAVPHTINGKTVEIAVRQAVEGLPVKNLDAIANPEILAYFKNRPELA